MSTWIATLGGIGLFLLGMSVMTDGLKGLAGSALRDVMARAAATPVRGTFWGAVVTLIVQSSSATTMTTIGMVSAGLLTFPQGLSLVFGANIGTTGTGWLVALLGVRVSLTVAAMPMVFAGALLRLLGRGRWQAIGGAVAGLGLLLLGLTTLQDGMAGIAQNLNPADLPAIWGDADVSLLRGALGVLLLVLVGAAMTTAMQSSSAAIAVSLSALHAGAIGADQAVALVIGQNIGTAVSSAMAAIGTTSPAKRTAVAYVGFKLLTASVALVLFSPSTRAILWAGEFASPALLLAGYHTLYNVVGVGILLPLIRPYARLIERIVPERGPRLTRYLDKSVLSVPPVAVEAARRTVASALLYLGIELDRTLDTPPSGRAAVIDPVILQRAEEAFEHTRHFLSRLGEPPGSRDEHNRLTSTLHALDHATRLADALRELSFDPRLLDVDNERRAVMLCRRCAEAARQVARTVAPDDPSIKGDAQPASLVLEMLVDSSRELADLRRAHRLATLESSGPGGMPVDAAMRRVELVRQLDRIGYHLWRAGAHLLGSVETVGVNERVGQPEAMPVQAMGKRGSER